ncbi:MULTISPECIES: hypothetical protein [Streptomyces]|uniref:Uncharacterized protein n=1 Tax=Streptomyces cacaoi TaxID=1898 RepID=A0A4Y3R562_STRCI|nr:MULTISPECIES: hypothetical protein [Streptomyces]NNG88650.1 hypothetical protein [Streptomyces cacaoi]GEB51883.1 hypothetical protein SCA03_44340 [Streptomyces cacaoi]
MTTVSHPTNPPSPDGAPFHDADAALDSLRDALSLHGIVLPSLGVDLASVPGVPGGRPPLLALGSCTAETAQQLATSLREAAR